MKKKVPGEVNSETSDGDDSEYWGNMWGWNLSFVGLALIVILLALMWMRSCQIEDLPDLEESAINKND